MSKYENALDEFIADYIAKWGRRPSTFECNEFALSYAEAVIASISECFKEGI